MGDVFLLIGGILSITYNHMTTTKEDYKELGFYKAGLLYILLFTLNWLGLVTSVALDMNDIKSKLNK